MVFVPSRGFLFFYKSEGEQRNVSLWFSSPHGDFSFSIERLLPLCFSTPSFSSPHGDFSFSMEIEMRMQTWRNGFSSPHGDFSFSIVYTFLMHDLLVVFVPSRGFLFFYYTPYGCMGYVPWCFRPLTGISLFL